jgi:hypothetical protein
MPQLVFGTLPLVDISMNIEEKANFNSTEARSMVSTNNRFGVKK